MILYGNLPKKYCGLGWAYNIYLTEINIFILQEILKKYFIWKFTRKISWPRLGLDQGHGFFA